MAHKEIQLSEEDKEAFEAELAALCTGISNVRASSLGRVQKAKRIEELEDKIQEVKKKYGVVRRHLTISVGPGAVKEPVKYFAEVEDSEESEEE